MYSQFLSDGEGSHRASDMRFFKGVALGFGASLLLVAIVTMASMPTTLPDTGAAEPSGLVALPSSPISIAPSRTAPLRGIVVTNGLGIKDHLGIKDGGFVPKIGTGDSSQGQQQQYYQPQYQQPTMAQPAAGEYSQEQLEFLQRTGKMPAGQPQYQQPTSAQPAQGQYSPEQLAFMQRSGKVPGAQAQVQQQTSARPAQGEFSEDQLAFMRRSMETSWGSADQQQEGYSGSHSRTYHNQKFS